MAKKIIGFLLLVLVGVWAAWRFVDRSYPIVNPQPRGKQIIAFGDSLTAGTGASDGHDYPAVLSQLIGVPVLNRGVPGDTTEAALARLENDVLGADPKIVIVCLGGNDSLQRLPSEKTFANLRRIIESIQDRGTLVVLAGVHSASWTDQFDPRFKKIAKEKGCVFVPNVLHGILDDPAKRSDQIHPNDDGYKMIAERIAVALRPYL